MDERAAAFERLFEAIHEGVYIGTIGSDGTHTVVANPHVKHILGYGSETPDTDVRFLDIERFHEATAHASLLERLAVDGSVVNYLARLRRVDQASVWVEVTARAVPTNCGLRVEALVRDVSERKKLDDERRDIYHQLLQAALAAANPRAHAPEHAQNELNCYGM